MVWRPSSRTPTVDPLRALQRVVEHQGEDTGEHPALPAPPAEEGSIHPTVGVAVKARPAVKQERHARERPRPASDPEPSHRRPERSAQAVITSTPTDEPGTTLSLTPRPATYEVGETPPEWWVARRQATLRAAALPDLRRMGRAFRRDHAAGFRQVLITLVVCLGLWTFIDAPALARSAATGPIGTRRTWALDTLRPIARVSSALGLDRIDHLADDLLGRNHPTSTQDVLPAALPPPTIPRSTRTTPTTAAPAPVRLRVPTPTNPLRVLVVGDSLGLSFGQSLATKLDATGLAKVTVDAREGTGLSRPDAFDWNAQLRSDIVHVHPEAIVVSFGGNDDQDIQVNGRFISFDSPQWQGIYASRVAAVAANAHTANALLLWSGLPVVRSGEKTQRFMTVMQITAAALANRPGAVFVDNKATLADANGHYATALPAADGTAQIVRQPDGIHETPAGADRLADHAIATMVANWHMVLSQPARPPTTAAPTVHAAAHSARP